MTARNWPKPAGRIEEVAPLTAAQRAAAMEAEVAKVNLALAQELADQLSACAAAAADLAGLKNLPDDIRQLAANLRADLGARSTTFGQAVARATIS